MFRGSKVKIEGFCTQPSRRQKNSRSIRKRNFSFIGSAAYKFEGAGRMHAILSDFFRTSPRARRRNQNFLRDERRVRARRRGRIPYSGVIRLLRNTHAVHQ